MKILSRLFKRKKEKETGTTDDSRLEAPSPAIAHLSINASGEDELAMPGFDRTTTHAKVDDDDADHADAAANPDEFVNSGRSSRLKRLVTATVSPELGYSTNHTPAQHSPLRTETSERLD